MSLDPNKLEKLRALADGSQQARCPACAEGGHDRSGEHLRIYPDGRFGCCVFPKDREHRRRIFALAGQRGPRLIRVKVATAKEGKAIRGDIFGRLGRVLATSESSDASDGLAELQIEIEEARTARTADLKSSQDSADIYSTIRDNSRTPRTPFQNSRACEKESPEKESDLLCKLKEFGEGVRSVREEKGPFLLADGTLVIPFASDPKFHWWNGGQSVAATLSDLRKENDALTF
jgi:hypothetical protein